MRIGRNGAVTMESYSDSESRSPGQLAAAHPFLLFGFASLAFVLLAIHLGVSPDSPAAVVVRLIIAPLYAGWTAAVLIAKAMFGPGTMSDTQVFVIRFLGIPLSLAPYLLGDWILGRIRRRRSRRATAA
jgi:hypothetical protein